MTTVSLDKPSLDFLLPLGEYTKKFKKGDFLFQEGTEANELFYIQSGIIQISKITPDGKELCLRICQKDDLIGELSMFSDQSTHMLNAKVLDDCEALVISKHRLECEIFENPKLGYEFLKWMSDQFRRTQTKLRDLILNGKKGALYSTLIRLANSYGRETEQGVLIDIALTNQQLANFCGTARESVNRMLNELKKKNIVTFKQGKITVHDLDYLKKVNHCEGCPIEYCRIE